jgi:transcriptional regulator with PAS, ATPase and Fis domain
VLDCAGAGAALLEADMFGWREGAIPGAAEARDGILRAAHGGTLFVDAIGELPLDLQPKLVRALDTKQVKPLGGCEWYPVDVRILCATHHDLRAEVANGRFREDLFYRVAAVQAWVPPLRARKQDLPLLVERFLAEQRPPRTLDDLPPNTMSLLLAHDWPGNVRELWNTVTRLSIFPDDEVGRAHDPWSSGAAMPDLGLREARALVVEHFERHYVARKLREHAGNVSRAAAAVGVSRQFLHRLMERYAIQRSEPAPRTH